MDIYIGGYSSVEYRVRQSLPEACAFGENDPVMSRLGAQGTRAARIRQLADTGPDNAAVRDALDALPFYLAQPVDLLVAQPNHRRSSALKTCHLWRKPLPTGAFVRVAPSVYMSTPEFAFHQLIASMDWFDILKTAYEFCSCYVRSAVDARGFRKCAPLTSVARLSAFTRDMPQGARNKTLVTRLLGHVADKSASPMETNIAIPLALPRHDGGYALGTPEMNAPVTLPPDPRGRIRLYMPDLLWRKEKVVVEYDSDMFHTGSDRIAHDSARRNELVDLGYTVITVTKQQFFDERLFHATALQVDNAIGKRHQERDYQYDWDARRSALYRRLLQPDKPWFNAI